MQKFALFFFFVCVCRSERTGSPGHFTLNEDPATMSLDKDVTSSRGEFLVEVRFEDAFPTETPANLPRVCEENVKISALIER